MNLVKLLLDHLNFIGAIALFLIGLYTVVTHSNLIKRIMGINIMGTAVFLFFIAIGDVKNGEPPIVIGDGSNTVFINPVPSVLILTGIVVSVSITVYSLSLAIRIYESYGTVDQEEIARMVSNEHDNH